MTTPGAGELQGVILAAGKGLRLQPFSQGLPKPLLPILDRSLLERQIEAMRELGIDEILVVVGHLGHHVVRTLGDGSQLGVRLSYVEQQETLGIAHALGRTESRVRGPFMLFLGDIYFETRDMSSLVEEFARDDVDGVLAVKVEEDVESLRRNFSVELDSMGFVRRVIEKPRHPHGELKGCGLYVLDDTFFDAVHRTPRSALRDEYELTDALQTFIDRGFRLVPAHVVERDFNLSYPADLLEINLQAMEREGLDVYVSESAVIDPGARLRSSVVMAGARLPAGARLDRCVVLPGEEVQPGEHERTIFAFGEAVQCP